jgi:glycosyltransferase involved in cell wall biosynthesis
MRLLPTLPHALIPQILAESDAFILASEYEGLPNALLEAMGWGCVPVVSDIRSGIPELIREGVNGSKVAVGDLRGFAERLAMLQRDPSLRARLSWEAARTVRDGGYRLQDMTDRYIALFGQVLDAVQISRYRRPRGRIAPPPWLPWAGYLPAPVRRTAHWLRGRKE